MPFQKIYMYVQGCKHTQPTQVQPTAMKHILL